jgi:hypothetical protein
VTCGAVFAETVSAESVSAESVSAESAPAESAPIESETRQIATRSELRHAMVAVQSVEDEAEARERRRLPRQALEALVVTVAFPAFGYALRPSDPFLLQASFPWLVLAPLLCGVQHGLALALGSAALLFFGACIHTDPAAWLGAEALDLALLEPLYPWGTGCLLMALIAGHFGDRFRSASVRFRAESEASSQRLTRLTRMHGVMQLSHARLQERLAAERWSLESCVEDAERQMGALTSLADLGRIVLELLANHGMVLSASLFVTKDTEGAAPDGTSSLGPAPLCAFGAFAEAAADGTPAMHPLVEGAWSTRRLHSVLDLLDDETAEDAAVLCAIPLASSRGRAIGVVAIHEMPFLAFQAEHLGRLALLTARLADLVEDRLVELVPAAESELARGETEDLERKRSGLFRIQSPTPPRAVAWHSQNRNARS